MLTDLSGITEREENGPEGLGLVLLLRNVLQELKFVEGV